MDTLPYLSNDDPHKRKRTATFIGLWIVFCLALALPMVAAHTAKRSIDLRSTWPAGVPRLPAIASERQRWLCAGMFLMQFLGWGSHALTLRRRCRLFPAQASWEYAFGTGINASQSALAASFCFSLSASLAYWGWPAVGGCVSMAMMAASSPRLSKLWPHGPIPPVLHHNEANQ